MEDILKGKGAPKSWSIFKDSFPKAHAWFICICKQKERQSRKPAWLTGEFLAKPKSKTILEEGWAPQAESKSITSPIFWA